LTWRNYFSSLNTTKYNYRSSGEEVLETHPCFVTPTFVDLETIRYGRWTWALQEKTKGRNEVIGGTDAGGWGFNPYWYVTDISGKKVPRLPGQTQDIADDDVRLRTEPFFRKGFPSILPLYQYPPGTKLTDKSEYGLLATFVPSRTLPIGANNISTMSNIDINNLKTGWPQERIQSDWRERWRHSDLKTVAYVFTYKLFDDMVPKGGLK
jgi:hypothetical protein